MALAPEFGPLSGRYEQAAPEVAVTAKQHWPCRGAMKPELREAE
jgi:hypothetical protein